MVGVCGDGVVLVVDCVDVVVDDCDLWFVYVVVGLYVE